MTPRSTPEDTRGNDGTLHEVCHHPTDQRRVTSGRLGLRLGLVLSLHLLCCRHGEGGEAHEWQFCTWQGSWVVSEETPKVGDGEIVFERPRAKRKCLSRVFEVDLDRTPALEIVTDRGNAHWRLTGQVGGEAELVLADYQTEGICRRNVAKRLFARGQQRVAIRFIMWGWGASDLQRLVLKRVAFVTGGEECEADALGGLMLERHQKVSARAEGLRPIRHEHPSLRYREGEKAGWQRRAHTTHRLFAKGELSIVERLDEEKAKPAILLDENLRKGDPHKWRGLWLQLRPPEPPALRPGEGWDPFEGVGVTATWRTLSWHTFSHWVIGSALTDDPVFAEQARRWVVVMARWCFWKRPTYIHFDFGTAYALQNFAMGYDIAHHLMSEGERAEVREAIAQLARGLYLNTLTGHGTIYNDLRGNHTAVTLCGLGLAGLALLGEHPEAPQWVALAEQFMLDAFEEHTSGAWTESPSYGNYGVNEWLKLAEMLRNVTGRDHLKHPFVKRYGEYQLMICDWEGRNLGYNGGGCGQRWNHWIFFYIAKECRWPEMQWLANFCLKEVEAFSGYGDAFWWVDPTLEARRPTARNVGKHFEDIGLSVWRSSWEDDCTILLHHCGRKGQHKEENMNHFTLYACGQRILPDGLGGRTINHNVPIIAGRKQNKWGPGKTLTFHTDGRSGYSLGDATRAYGPKTLRHVLYLRPGVVVIVDDIALSSSRSVPIEFRLHPNGETVTQGNAFRVTAGDVTLVGICVDENGEKLPIDVAPRKKRRRATHDVVAKRQGRGATRTITLLRSGRRSELGTEVVRTEKGDGCLDFVMGLERVRVGTEPGQVARQCATNAGLWVARIVSGRPVAVLAASVEGDDGVWLDHDGIRTQGEAAVSWASDVAH